MKYNIVVAGKGTSGVISAIYMKFYWMDKVNITLVHDSKQKTIGVGESLTPIIYNFLNYVNITREELIKNVNATVKLGLKFKNWNGDGESFYHTFYHSDQMYDQYNFISGYEIANNCFDNSFLYGKYLLDHNMISNSPNSVQSLHFDANILNEYILNKYKHLLEIIDGKIVDVSIKEKNIIDYLQLEDGRKIKGDFFVDASGFNSVLFRKFNRRWVDKTDWMPLNRCIPNPMSFEHEEINPYTTAEASSEGWILQVPLQDRWGTGYLYSDQFTTDEMAFQKFENFLKEKYKKNLTNVSRVINFKSGYWKEQWIGNCLAVGLSSGFAEPLEATNIHQTVYQIEFFVNNFNFKILEFDRIRYNEINNIFYDRIYDYIRFCYTGNRHDSPFWLYMQNNIPEKIKILEEKIKYSIMNEFSYTKSVFDFINFTVVAYGLNKINKKEYEKEIENRFMFEKAKERSKILKNEKKELEKFGISHIKYIKNILEN